MQTLYGGEWEVLEWFMDSSWQALRGLINLRWSRSSSCQPYCWIPEQPTDFGFGSCCWLFSFHGQTFEFLLLFLPAQSSDWPCDSAVDLGQCLTICAGPCLVCLLFQKGVGNSCATDEPVRFMSIYIYFYYYHLFYLIYSIFYIIYLLYVIYYRYLLISIPRHIGIQPTELSCTSVYQEKNKYMPFL